MVSRLGCQPPNCRPQGHHLLGPLGQQGLQPQLLQQEGGPAAALGAVVPPHRGVVEGGHHAAGEVELHEVLQQPVV